TLDMFGFLKGNKINIEFFIGNIKNTCRP
ncbi:uncharacterized protein METZ01_LOCUS438823, partial [marine metagenome]